MSRKSYGLQPIEQKITSFLKPLFSGSKKEFILINNLVKNWDDIIGKKYAKFCYPKSVTFEKSKNTAKLTVAVHNSSVGFFLENNSDFLIEKIAKLYGHKSITKIIIKQEPKSLETKTREEIKLPKEQQEKLTTLLTQVENQDLAQTLERLGKEIFKK